MDRIYAKYAGKNSIIGIGTGRTMKEFASHLEPDNTYVPSSIQTELFLSGLPMTSSINCTSIDVYFDSADFYTPNGDLIKGGGGALTNEKLLMSMAKNTVILVQPEKKINSLEGQTVPIEIIKSSYSYVTDEILTRGLDYALRKVDGSTPFLTDHGNLIIDVEYDKAFFDECIDLVGIVEHGHFKCTDSVIIEEI